MIEAYLVGLLLIILCMYASSRVDIRTRYLFDKYHNLDIDSGMTGASVAKRILSHENIDNIKIEQLSVDDNFKLDGSFHHKKQAIQLSRTLFSSKSITAAVITAHECGHVMQYTAGWPLQWFKVYNLFSVAVSLWVLGTWIKNQYFVQTAIIIALICTILYFFNVLIEIDASIKAIKLLAKTRILMRNEIGVAKNILATAALSYLCGLATFCSATFTFLTYG